VLAFSSIRICWILNIAHFLENYIGTDDLQCHFIAGRCLYVCCTKHGRRTCPLWRISWYHRMYNAIDEVFTNWGCYNQGQLYLKLRVVAQCLWFIGTGRAVMNMTVRTYEMAVTKMWNILRKHRKAGNIKNWSCCGVLTLTGPAVTCAWSSYPTAAKLENKNALLFPTSL